MKKIKINLVSENTKPDPMQMKQCPDIIKNYEKEFPDNLYVPDPHNSRNMAMYRAYEQCKKYYAKMKAAEDTINDPKSSEGEKSKAKSNLNGVISAIEMDKLDENSNYVFERYLENFIAGLLDFNITAVGPATNAGEKLKYSEENNCVTNYGSHLGQAAIISVYYVGLKTLFAHSLSPRFRQNPSKFPPVFKALASLGSKGNTKFRKYAQQVPLLKDLVGEFKGDKTKALASLNQLEKKKLIQSNKRNFDGKGLVKIFFPPK